MGVKKVGTLIKEARTEAGFTQEQLARKIAGLTASDISKAERGEKALTQAQLKSIAKATGVTQKSLLDAAGTTGTSSTAAKKTTTTKTTTGTSMKVSTTERKLVELYRSASSDDKKKVMSILKGDYNEGGEFLSSILGGALDSVLKK